MRAAVPLVLDFEECHRELRPLVGGKVVGLAEMARAGLPVPPGFAVTTGAFATLFHDLDLARDVARLSSAGGSDLAGELEATGLAVRARVERAVLDAGVTSAVGEAYQRLCDRCGTDQVAVAVRSSGTCEDEREASSAGGHDSFLAVRGVDDVVRHIARCWSSLWTPRAIAYRRRMGLGRTGVAMAVAVQEMAWAKAAGVAFTLNPANGDRSQVAIEATWGLGQAVVSGEVTPDHFLVDKVLFEITGRRVSEKTTEYQVATDGVEPMPISGPRATCPCLTDAEVKEVARLARLIERHFGEPQDIEWAVNPDPGASGGPDVVLLQARPETVWSRRRRAPVAHPSGGVRSIAAALCAPLESGPR